MLACKCPAGAAAHHAAIVQVPNTLCGPRFATAWQPGAARGAAVVTGNQEVRQLLAAGGSCVMLMILLWPLHSAALFPCRCWRALTLLMVIGLLDNRCLLLCLLLMQWQPAEK